MGKGSFLCMQMRQAELAEGLMQYIVVGKDTKDSGKKRSL